ncbi:MAG: fructosamine kinase family protein [Persicimonas sp.]
MNLHHQIEQLTGTTPKSIEPLRGGCIGTVRLVRMPGGGDLVARNLVAKLGDAQSKLSIEGEMLRYLGEHSGLPVPEVTHSSDELLVMEFIDSSGGASKAAHRHAAELLAELHGHTADKYGFERDTLIGSLDQPNPWEDSWLDFFAEHRLSYLAEACVAKGQMPASLGRQVDSLCTKLDRYIDRPNPPSLIHGDVWGGNVLFDGDRIAGFIDPAVYYADPEIELAFTCLFRTFDEAFYARYDELRGIADGFWEVRKDLYNLYPLLVHVWHFGGGYVGQVRGVLGGLV